MLCKSCRKIKILQKNRINYILNFSTKTFHFTALYEFFTLLLQIPFRQIGKKFDSRQSNLNKTFTVRPL